MDVWTTMEDSISLGEIRVKSGRLIDLAGGLMMTENPNVLVIDKESFLAWYRRDKEKIAHYLSCVDLKIYQEEFLNRLAKLEPPQSRTKSERGCCAKTYAGLVWGEGQTINTVYTTTRKTCTPRVPVSTSRKIPN